jgi:DNA-directed RNA polymerase beta' subunit
MSIYPELQYDRVISPVVGIQFTILSEQAIRRMSVMEVTDNATFANNQPVANGLFDTRMGVIDGNRVCATCMQRNTFCPGHFGHIVLARPVFYVQYYDVVRKLMKCVCHRCSRVLVDLEGDEARAILSRKMSRQRRFEAMSKLCAKTKRCGHDTLDGCGAKVPDKVVKTDDTTMRLKLVWKDIGAPLPASRRAAAHAAAAPAEEPEEPEILDDDDEDEDDEDAGNDAAAAAAAAASAAATSASSTTAAAAARGGGGGGLHEVIFNAEDVLRVLRRVTDVDAEALGFSSEFARPEWLICSVLPVPPPSVRPSVCQDSGQRQEDDITHKLYDIIKTNRDIRNSIERGVSFDTIDTSQLAQLQYHIATLIDNSMPNMFPAKDRAGRMLRSLTERLRHKEGRIRSNLLGKRVDFSARTVITPDPNLSIDELGVPLKVAMNLTFPEVVGPHNRANLQRLVLAGPDAYPGAKQVRKMDEGGRTIRLRGNRDVAAIVLRDGDVVERHLLNGDYVLFNRQPSLHKMSMMAHRVRVMPHNTFRLNVCVCASYNADFDGDEMNMHVPQSLLTHYELKELAAVPLHVLSPRYSKPIITIVQDVALGVYRITQPHVRVTQRQLFNLACSNPVVGGSPVGGSTPQPPGGGEGGGGGADGGGGGAGGGGGSQVLFSGREVLSTVLPATAMYRCKAKDDEDDGVARDDVLIQGGRILSGVLSGDAFSKASVGLVHATYNTLGPAAVTAMLNGVQKLICDWLVLSGFSVGVSDLAVPAADAARVRDELERAKRGVRELLDSVHAGRFRNDSTKSDADDMELKIMALLGKAGDVVERVVLASAGPANRMLNMIAAKSKGKSMNYRQMTACLGSQAIDQRRVPDGFDHRTLPHFTKYDDGPEARGFVQHSFIDGLTPHEFFFHAMAGRIGLIDTAVRTSEVGYLQRRLVKAMEDCKVQHDLTVRNANNHIVQFLYGEDGMDAVRLEFHDVPYIAMDPARMRDAFLVVDVETELGPFVHADVLAALVETADAGSGAAASARLEAHFRQLLDDRRGIIMGLHGGLEVHNQPLVYPVNVQRLVETAAAAMARSGGGGSDLSPLHVLDQIDELADELRIGGEREHSVGIRWMPVLLRAFLSPKPLLRTHRLSRRAFDQVVRQVRTDFYAAIAHPSEMVGIVAAQSLGEPAMQLSVLGATRIQVSGSHTHMHDGPIGEYVDALLERHAGLVQDLGGGSVVLDLPEPEDAFVVGVSDDEKTSWRRISQVSRHPANGGMVRIHTRSGRTTCATLSHSFLRRTERGIAPIRGSDLVVGMRVPVARFVPPVATPLRVCSFGAERKDLPLTRELGWLCGSYLAGEGSCEGQEVDGEPEPEGEEWAPFSDGDASDADDDPWHQVTVRDDPPPPTPAPAADDADPGMGGVLDFFASHFGEASARGQKRIPAWAFAADADFQRGLLCGYFERSADGGRDGIDPDRVLCATSVGEALADDVILMLARFGVFAHKSKESERHLSVRVAGRDARRFRDQVGPLAVPLCAEALEDAEDDAASVDDVMRIPELGAVLDAIADALELPARGPAFRRLVREEAHGRRALGQSVERAIAGSQPPRAARLRALFVDELPALRRALAADVVWDEIVELELLPDPGEMVYDLTVPGNDSFMVDAGVLVHNTLNSVVHGTELMLRSRCCRGRGPATGAGEGEGEGESVGTRIERAKIGELVDARMAEAEADPVAARANPRLESHPNDTTLLWLKDGGDEGPVHSGLEALSVDEDGRVLWKEVTAVTRHPVVNRDGSDTLIRVTTESGREVVATRGKSFLTRRDNKVVGIDGEDLRVGDSLPVTRLLPVDPADELTHLELRDWLPLPLSAGSGTFAPERLPLDAACGFYAGAYLAEGSECDGQVHISNSDHDCQARIIAFSEGLGIDVGWHHPDNSDNICLHSKVSANSNSMTRHGDAQLTETIVLDSQVLSDLTITMFGRGATNKRLPACLLAANKDFLRGVIDGYFSGEGGMFRAACDVGGYSAPLGLLHDLANVLLRFPGEGDMFRVACVVGGSSASSGLLHDLANVLLRFDIGVDLQVAATDEGTSVLPPCHKLFVRDGDALRFAQTFAFTQPAKQALLQQMLLTAEMRPPSHHTPKDVVPVLELPGSKTRLTDVHRDDLARVHRGLVAMHADPADVAAVAAAMREEVMWDKVVSIEDVPNPQRYVYDLTVRDTRNFILWNAKCCRDTFHLAGAASSTKVTQGLPRMKELLSVSKNIKTPSMRIKLRREWATRQERAQMVLSEIEMTHFRDLVSRASVHYDPDDELAEDAEFVRFHRAFESAAETAAAAATAEAAEAAAAAASAAAAAAASTGGAGKDKDSKDSKAAPHVQCGDARASPWLLRFEFDRMRMLDLQVTMLDLEATLVDFYEDRVSCVLSDDNAEQLVCRIRLTAAADSSDMLTEIKALEQSIMEHIVVKGLPRVEKAVLEKPQALPLYDDASDVFHPGDEWTIETTGSNLADVMAHPSVDYTRTETNDVYEVYTVLGVEAARQLLIKELRKVLDSMDLDHRHLSLLADTMSNRGFFMSIDRHGINNRGELGPLAKCSFEQTTDMLIKAGIFAEHDRINGVSANIMLGQVAPCGTGDCTILMDNEHLARNGVVVSLDGAHAPKQQDAARPAPRRPAPQQQQQQQQQQPRMVLPALEL